MNFAAIARDRAELPRGHLVSLPLNRLVPAKVKAFAAAPTPAGMTLHYQGARSVRQRQKLWNGVSANIAQVHCDGELYVDLGADAARLSVVLEEVGGRIEIRSNDWRGRP